MARKAKDTTPGQTASNGTKPKRGRGRPKGSGTLYTPELGDRIADELMKGRTLIDICRSADMPNEATVRQWALQPDHDFYPKYSRAREIGFCRMAEELLHICDETTNENWQRDRLRYDARKWLLSKALPKIYGDKVEVSGKDGGPIQISWIKPDPEPSDSD